MNYKKIHDDLILLAKSRDRMKGFGIYYEKHHILPRAIGGDNSSSNLVLLTPKEHYVVHHLLTKIFHTGKEHQSMIKAFHRLCYGNRIKYDFIPSRVFEQLRVNYAKILSESVKGDLHPMYGKKHTEETRRKMSDSRQQRILDGTNEGNRKPHSDLTKMKMSKVKLGKYVSYETRLKQSLALQGREVSEETRLKISMSTKGRIFSAEHKKKLSEKAKLRWQNIQN